MARHYYSGARDTVDGTRKISIFWLRKNGYVNSDNRHFWGSLKWSIDGEPTGNIRFEIETDESKGAHMQFIYRVKQHGAPEEKYKDMDYKFDLLSIPCRYGGKRWFFRCGLYKSAQYCGKRVAILYSVGDYFGCRYCANLSYDSCNENKRYRGTFWGTSSNKADEYHSKLKRHYYRGKPTRKYRRYLKLSELSRDIDERAIQDFMKENPAQEI